MHKLLCWYHWCSTRDGYWTQKWLLFSPNNKCWPGGHSKKVSSVCFTSRDMQPPKFAQLCSSHYASGQAGLREPILRHNTSMGSVLIHTHTHSHTQKQTFLAFVKVLQTSKFEDPICKRVDFFSTRPTHSALEWRPFRPSISKHLTSWGMRLKNQIYLQIGPLTSW